MVYFYLMVEIRSAAMVIIVMRQELCFFVVVFFIIIVAYYVPLHQCVFVFLRHWKQNLATENSRL